MIKRIITIFTAFVTLMTFCAFVYADNTPALTAYSTNSLFNGVSQAFFFENIVPDTVKVDDTSLTADTDYKINTEQGKLYIFGSVFKDAKAYTVTVSDDNSSADCEITLADGTQTVEYSIKDSYTKGDKIDPSSTAGAEHSALGNNGGRRPIIARGISKSDVGDYWVQWQITQKGKYTIDYWLPKYHVNCANDVIVVDKNGTHTFSGLLTSDEYTPEYVKLKENGEPFVFDFSGDGNYYLKVSPTQNGKGGDNFLIDSFKMTSHTTADNTDTPTANSDTYTIAGNSIDGCLFHTTAEELAKNITIPDDCVYEISDLSDGYVVQGTKFTVKKIFNDKIKKEYTVGAIKYITSHSYTVNDESSTISDIPYGETYEAFTKNIIRNSLVTIKIFSGETEIENGTLQSGYTLKAYADEKELGSYTLNVTPASGDNTVTSSVYTVKGEIIEVPYGEKVEAIFKNITLPKFATVSHPYENDLTKSVIKGFDFTCTAQNGDTKTYTVKITVSGSDKTSALQSAVYTVSDGKVGVVEKNTSVDKLLESLTATNGGTVKVFDMDMKEKTSGNISGGDSVRVYPRYKIAGSEYTSYGITVAPEYRKLSEPKTVYSCADNSLNTEEGLSFTYKEFRDGSKFTIKRDGYNGRPADAGDSEPRFNYKAPKDEVIKIDYYLPLDNQTGSGIYDVEVYKNNSKIDGGTYSTTVGELATIGIYKLKSGETLSVGSTINENHSGNVNLVSAALFTEMTEYTVSAGSASTDSDDYCTFNISGNFEIDAKSVENGMKIISENGNEMPFEVDTESTPVTVKTKYPLEKGVRYYLYTSEIKAQNGETLSRAELIPLIFPKEDNYVTVRLDREGSELNIEADITLKTADSITVYAMLMKNNAVTDAKIETADVTTDGKTVKFAFSNADCDKAVVYAVDSQNKLICNTYYAD